MKVVILAAGIGSRLNSNLPKTLTLLKNGCSILQNQIKNLTRYVGVHDIVVVVGFKKELIMEAFPQLSYVYNDFFDTTNTAKSLLRALVKIQNEDVLWLNGDVVFDHKIIQRMLKFDCSAMAVKLGTVGEEEIKFTTNGDGTIKEVSKTVHSGKGEAIGINMIKASDLEMFKRALASCSDNDYFERGLELSIMQGMKLSPLDISDLNCVEVDFAEDLNKANTFIG